MEFEMVNKIELEELKRYLQLRGLKSTGEKKELVARAFDDMENNVAVIPNAEQVEKRVSE